MRNDSILRKWLRLGLGVVLLCAAVGLSASGQTFTTLVTFNGANGSEPMSSPIQGLDGNIYGTTEYAETSFTGTFYRITPGGTFTSLHTFIYTDGARPIGRLILGADGDFYGTTIDGGTGSGGCTPYFQCGTVFKITPTGVVTTLHSFSKIDGGAPYGGLVQAADGSLYGTTQQGGANGFGTVFRVSLTGTFTTLYNFCSQSGCSDGSAPYAGLVQGIDGNLYGTTSTGGANNQGTVFRMTPAGVLTTVYSFCPRIHCQAVLYHPLIQASDGDFYGTTDASQPNSGGSVFKFTPGGQLNTIYAFTPQDYNNGYFPSGLFEGSDGNFYGTTTAGGEFQGHGVIFSVTPTGVLTLLHTFDTTIGYGSLDAPVQATSGVFYGTTALGGAYNVGTLWSLSVGLPPSVQTVPQQAKIGTNIFVLGYGLTGASSVSFNSVAATYTVVSDTLIKTTVPAGATAGYVQVTTPSGTLTSNTVFRVK